MDICPARMNFTVAHELGHILLNHFTYTDNSLNMNYIMEREANTFVDELLMPTEFILWHGCGAKEIEEIYEVSATAAKNKMLYIKSNALYKEIQAEISSIRFFYKDVRHVTYSDTGNKMVERLRNAWLDPDYEFGGF